MATSVENINAFSDFLDQVLGILGQALEASAIDGPALAHANDAIDNLFPSGTGQDAIVSQKAEAIRIKLKGIIAKAHSATPISIIAPTAMP